MKVTKNELKAIINEELQAELNEGFFDELKRIALRLFGVRKPAEDSKKYLTRVASAIEDPRFKFKGYPKICDGKQVHCPEKAKCSPYCGKNPFEMKKKINALADAANRSA